MTVEKLKVEGLLEKAKNLIWLTEEEGLYLYEHAGFDALTKTAYEIRQKLVPGNTVGWIIDRNVNITNVCISGCKFCNFHCKLKDDNAFITTKDEYLPRIKELFALGGNQLLLQGGLHPKLGLAFYTELFSLLKNEFPEVKLHALGPPEIHHISRLEKMTYRDTLKELINAGLDSLPGAGAEILDNEIRRKISPGKCTSEQWLSVMREAHKLNMVTSATMMFGHLDAIGHRIRHFIQLRQVQSEKPKGNYGFVTFVPWPFMDNGTELVGKMGVRNSVSGDEYIKTVALARIMMPNIKNLQASWLTVGKETAQKCLYAGANDFGSIMIEENVVSSAGANNSFNAEGIQEAVKEAGFIPKRRNQAYEFID